MRWLHFILSHSIFIALCAVALCYQTYILLGLPPDADIYAFVFFSTLGSYNFYWLISKFSFTKNPQLPVFLRTNASYFFFFSVASIGMLFYILNLHYLYPYIAVAVLFTLLYSLPLWPFAFARQARKAGVLKPTMLALTWTYVTIVFPAAGHLRALLLPVVALFIARFFFMMMLCMIFDMRDSRMDKLHALHTLATDLPHRTLRAIMTGLFILYMGAGIFLRVHLHDNLQVICFLVTGLLVWWVYRLSLKKQAYLFYYFIIDGMMIVTAFFTWLATLV